MISLSLRSLEEYVEATKASGNSWVQLAPVSNTPVEPPAFFLGDLPGELTYALFSERRTGPVKCFQLRNVKLTADGIVYAGNNFLWSTLLNHPDYYVERVMAEMAPVISGLPVRAVVGPCVMLSGPGSHIYGHWLVDVLPRLYVLACCGYGLGELNFIIPKSLPQSSRLMLSLLGIREAQLVDHDDRRELIEVDHLLLPANLRHGSRMHPMMREAAAFLKSRLTPDLPLNSRMPHRRLFISRAHTDPSRSVINRAEIEQIAQAYAYEIVYPEQLSIEEQIHIFSETSQLIGEYGSGLHNSIFMPPGSVVMALRGTSHHPGFIQSALGQVFRQPTGYVFSSTPIEAIHQSFSVLPNAFKLGLDCATQWINRSTEYLP